MEFRQRQEDIAADEAASAEDWARLQVGLLDRLRRALDLQLAEINLTD